MLFYYEKKKLYHNADTIKRTVRVRAAADGVARPAGTHGAAIAGRNDDDLVQG